MWAPVVEEAPASKSHVPCGLTMQMCILMLRIDQVLFTFLSVVWLKKTVDFK